MIDASIVESPHWTTAGDLSSDNQPSKEANTHQLISSGQGKKEKTIHTVVNKVSQLQLYLSATVIKIRWGRGGRRRKLKGTNDCINGWMNACFAVSGLLYALDSVTIRRLDIYIV